MGKLCKIKVRNFDFEEIDNFKNKKARITPRLIGLFELLFGQLRPT
ncbi:hypothetical protein PALB_33270 [Pseudoalteromonas luteoviolacea B = ATCC 29581]|nr:hypothetical protein PALB_33270 [Pseudoalteromonas luteoviolacea B = ATCC 29581]